MMQLTRNSIRGSRIATVGFLVAALIAAFMLTAKPAQATTYFTVTNINDSGAGSLRDEILAANATAGADVIEFYIPGTGVHTITPASALPKITGPVTINGYSQPGAQPNTKAVGSDAVLKIELSGAGAPGADGLVIGGSNSSVKGLVINRWNQGIRIDGSDATGNKVVGNFIGTDASGTSALGNYAGVRFQNGSNNVIGGTTAAQRNVLSGNRFSGISIGDGDVIKGNRIVGNFIGTDASGTSDLGNASYGINVDDAPENTIGGSTTAERNVISGNDKSGVNIYSRRTRVTGNFIGTDASGTNDLGNSDHGVYIAGANNTVGGIAAGTRNVISGNDENGVRIDGVRATGNKVAGNFIGTDKSGILPLGNSYDGVRLDDAPANTVGGTTAGERNVISANGSDGVDIEGTDATDNKIMGNYLGVDKNGAALGNSARGVFIYDSPNNTVGGTTSGAANVISANTASGVSLFTGTATGDRILSNSIFSNGGLGIDLYDDGPTPNDPADADDGPNNLQNFPVLSSAKKNANGTTTVRGKLNSTASKTFRVELFSNPQGGDEGKTLLGSVTVSTDGTGNATFTFSTKKAIKVGQNITATATGPGGNTSEFSLPEKVVAS